ncbi:MAG: hypothetical protein RIQ41_445 [Candidatus Parcubacteria bacterium]|jgi:uncharacterized membrane protein
MTTWHKKHEDALTFGEKMADGVAKWMGSWKFIVLQTCFVVLWMTLNVIGIIREWDPYPFILLNLLFSTQAAYAAPIIMMAQNRDVERDRVHAEQDYETNRKAKEEIEDLQKRLSRIENEKLDAIMSLLEKIDKK